MNSNTQNCYFYYLFGYWEDDLNPDATSFYDTGGPNGSGTMTVSYLWTGAGSPPVNSYWDVKTTGEATGAPGSISSTYGTVTASPEPGTSTVEDDLAGNQLVQMSGSPVTFNEAYSASPSWNLTFSAGPDTRGIHLSRLAGNDAADGSGTMHGDTIYSASNP